MALCLAYILPQELRWELKHPKWTRAHCLRQRLNPAGPECGVCVPSQRHSFLLVQLPTRELVEGARVLSLFLVLRCGRWLGFLFSPSEPVLKYLCFFLCPQQSKDSVWKKRCPDLALVRHGCDRRQGEARLPRLVTQPLLSAGSQESQSLGTRSERSERSTLRAGSDGESGFVSFERCQCLVVRGGLDGGRNPTPSCESRTWNCCLSEDENGCSCKNSF